jgi:hypothetical protein
MTGLTLASLGIGVEGEVNDGDAVLMLAGRVRCVVAEREAAEAEARSLRAEKERLAAVARRAQEREDVLLREVE